MKDLKDLFHETLQDIYYAEHAVLKALPKMAKRASTPKLKSAFESHMKETQGQIERLDKVFAALGEKSKSKKCDAIDAGFSSSDDAGLNMECRRVLLDVVEQDYFEPGLK